MNAKQRNILKIMSESPLWNLLSPHEKLAWIKQAEEKLLNIEYGQIFGIPRQEIKHAKENSVY